MSWNIPDVYGSPDTFELEMLGTVEWSDESYSFDMTAVLRDKDGALYWADDSGCSCPSPFEDFTSKDKLSTGTAQELQAHLEGRLKNAAPKSDWNDPQADVADIMLKVTS